MNRKEKRIEIFEIKTRISELNRGRQQEKKQGGENDTLQEDKPRHTVGPHFTKNIIDKYNIIMWCDMQGRANLLDLGILWTLVQVEVDVDMLGGEVGAEERRLLDGEPNLTLLSEIGPELAMEVQLVRHRKLRVRGQIRGQVTLFSASLTTRAGGQKRNAY